jgi:Type IV secretory pathway, VirB3-like protein
MTINLFQDVIAGFEMPVHRALTEPILLAGVPRSVAIINGTLAAAVGLGLRLWLVGLVLGPLDIWPRLGRRGEIRSSWRWCAGTFAIRRISAHDRAISRAPPTEA